MVKKTRKKMAMSRKRAFVAKRLGVKRRTDLFLPNERIRKLKKLIGNAENAAEDEETEDLPAETIVATGPTNSP